MGHSKVLHDAPDLDDDEQVDRAMREAVERALREHKEEGMPVVGWRDGAVHWVSPQDIAVPQDKTARA